jgi:hypothetical protein
MLHTLIFQTEFDVMNQKWQIVCFFGLGRSSRTLSSPSVHGAVRISTYAHTNIYIYTHTYIYIYTHTHTHPQTTDYLPDSPAFSLHNLANTLIPTLDILVSKNLSNVFGIILLYKTLSSTDIGTIFGITLYAAGDLTCMLRNFSYVSSFYPM